MTEGTPAPLAVYQDVEQRWRPLTGAEQTVATTRIGDASGLLRLDIPDIDDRAAADPNLARLVTAKVVDAVLRVLQNPMGAKQLQESAGPFTRGMTLNGGPTGLFFTDDELAQLRPRVGAAGWAAIGTSYVGTRHGWAPTQRPQRRSGGWAGQSWPDGGFWR